jgi:hypothetical protein
MYILYCLRIIAHMIQTLLCGHVNKIIWVLLTSLSLETTYRIVDNANRSKYWYKNALLSCTPLKLDSFCIY